ncbi:accessory factor associated with RNA polymerase II [Phytophthora pseudosyringae]|uniref:Accessory factor associated with RNA polymerase II n=1 Tax=Phytophthora pseudosyringae TaxID=221518 RepID=A0A8T1W4B4_9STRA|nr:accessory factor associated with RNA polymerase II [Phytophthora pseudosyringae]
MLCTLVEGIPSAFFSNSHEGIGAYFAGKWDVAMTKLTDANQIWEDGPTKVVLKVMEAEGRTEEGEFMAPMLKSLFLVMQEHSFQCRSWSPSQVLDEYNACLLIGT